jgi:CO/xanthine dehydrogenase FAD-binding subunit
MLNILGVHDGSVLFSDLFRGVSGSMLDSNRELIAITEVNNTVLLQCIASASPPSLPLQTARALATRIRRRGGSDCSLLMVAATCQTCSGHAHAARLALTSSSPTLLVDSWSSLRMCWFSYKTGALAAAAC